VFDYLEGAYLDYSEGTFFEGIQQLLPAHTLTLQGDNLVVRRFWDLPEAGEETELSLQEAAAQFQDLFRDSVQIRLRSDVPIGSCLSGGLDSSSIVCVANELMFGTGEVSAAIVGTRQKTFSSCFEDLRYDERRFIQPVLNRTGAQAHYTFPDPKELAANVYEVIRQQEEPFGSTSIFAQWNVMRLASQCGVKVLLDGQGADELLGGYQGFFGAFFGDLIAKRRWALLLNEMVRYRRLHGPIQSYVLANLARAFLPKQLVQFTRSRITGSVDWITADFRRRWAPIPSGPAFPSNFLTLQHSLLTRNGLRALLHYEDRNSMAFGVETRLPFLDYRVVEFLYRLRPEYKIRNGWTKMLLRQAMDGLLPDEIRWRTDKMGFVTPEDIWFRTSWREMAREILCDRRTRERGYVNCAAAFKEFEAHAAGQRNISFTIWRWLNLELWSRTFLDQPGWNAALS
jgi:asparagine synthase (glutamine-hydrolysing)